MIAEKFFGYRHIRVGKIPLVYQYGLFAPVSFV
jgi:hypothetical protein